MTFFRNLVAAVYGKKTYTARTENTTVYAGVAFCSKLDPVGLHDDDTIIWAAQ